MVEVGLGLAAMCSILPHSLPRCNTFTTYSELADKNIRQ